MQKSFKKLISGLVVWVAVFSYIVTPMVNAYSANSASTSFIMPDHDVSLKATSQANDYTVVFNANSWTGTMSNLSMTYGESESLTANTFTKTWYTFQWWNTNSWASVATYIDGESVSNLTTTNNWTVTLYAIWKANTYEVRFNKNPWVDTLNSVNGTMSNQDFVYDTEQALTDNGFTRDGYEFLWWSEDSNDTSATYTNGQTVNNLTSTSGAVVDLYAIWEANTDTVYTVKHYFMNTNWEYPSEPTYTDTGSATTYAVVTAWTRNPTGFTLSGSAQTWHVKWDWTTVFEYYYIRGQYTVTLHAGRWIALVQWNGTYYYGDDISVSAQMQDWYQNLTWTWDKDTANFNMPASNVDMTASATPITYTITLDVWSGTISWQPTTYDVEQDIVIPDPTRVWYDFVWWSGTNLSTPTTGLTISPHTWFGNLEYEAVWKAKDNVVYTVHHYYKVLWQDRYEQYGADETHTDWTADAVLEMSDFDIVIPCTTYTGWSLTQSTSWLTNKEETFRVMPDGTTHVYLYYTRNVHDVTLSMDGNIASVTLSWDTSENTITKSFECGATVTIDTAPKAWYHFLQWSDIWAIHLNP